MTGIYRLADLNIEITSLHMTVHNLCKEYSVEGAGCRPDFAVSTGQADIEFEREKSARINAAEGLAAPKHSDRYLELLAVYRKIAERLPEYGAFLFHCSAVAVGGYGYLFTAKSGTGKSTHARLWRELLGPAAVMINDDKPFIKVAETKTLVYGTPWDGKHHLSSNMSVPVRAVCILERAEENRIREITRGEALPMLVQQAYRPFDPAALSKTMNLIDRMDARFYRLGCNMDISAAELSYRAMSGE